jgi:NAD(P)-dependent dehydrogenase (short-subunit alcohol dehydrogenase family)
VTADASFTGRVAIVTGAGKGLGRAYALWLAKLGCAVVVNNRNNTGESSAASVVAEIRTAGGEAVAHEGAVEDPKSAEAMVDLARAQFGRLDILVCNAGIQHWRDFASLDVEEMRRLIDVNLWGTLLPVKAAWSDMLRSHYGRIVLTGSGAGLWGQQQSADYCASKAAMIGLARALTLDVPSGCDIRINVIAPAAYTGISADVIDVKWSDFMSPDRVAPVVGWLASEACDISGAVLHAGAGRVRRAHVIESARLDLEDDVGRVMRALEVREEPSSSFAAGAQLMPELFDEPASAAASSYRDRSPPRRSARQRRC